ncbi:MAG: tat pathway signal sequence [Ideonella sp. MAG2]|nr:MAG: tat pathway signal sequence [Ideonella sp. MAG2]
MDVWSQAAGCRTAGRAQCAASRPKSLFIEDNIMWGHIPVWVFAVLLGLIAIGWRQTRTRTVKPSVLIGVGAGLLVYSAWGVISAFGLQPAPLLAWGVGLALALGLLARWVAPQGLVLQGHAVQVPGSWLPMGILLSIFLAKFALGMATGLGAPFVHALWFMVLASLVFGLLSGTFAARAWAVHRFAQAA